MSNFGSLLRLDTRLLLRRALFRTVAAASILAAVIAVVASGGKAGGGWWRLAQAIRVLVPLLLAFGSILGAVSIAGDAASGSLRGVLMRPVSRTAIVVSRAVVLALGIAAVYVASVLCALLVAIALDRFGTITYDAGGQLVDIISAEELLPAAAWLIATALPAIVCATLIGLMVSSWWNDPSSSTICALLLVLSPYVVETVFGASTQLAFTHGATFGAAVFSDLAEGVLTRLGLVEDRSALLTPLWTPVAIGVASVVSGCALFSVRDFKG